MVAGQNDGVSRYGDSASTAQSSNVDVQDILHAWRDFECSFFAGALLCPKVPFRQLLDRYGYEVDVSQLLEVSPSVVMRRMTAVSSYPHWHYFDAYAAGKFKAVYRGNGIPLPWGNMCMVDDPCQHWSVFRMINIPDLMRVARILNIAWIERGIDSEARLICSRGTSCPRENNCYEGQGTPLNEMRSSTAQRKVFGDF